MDTRKSFSSNIPIEIQDSFSNEIHTVQHTKNDGRLVSDLKSVRATYDTLQSESKSKELQQQKEDALEKNARLIKALEEALNERNNLHEELKSVEASSRDREDELLRNVFEGMREIDETKSELDGFRERIDLMLSEKTRVLSETLKAIKPIKESLARVIERLDEIEVENIGFEREEFKFDKVTSTVAIELKAVSKLMNEVEIKMNVYQEITKKEKKELEKIVVSLTEENQDLSCLLRIALVEKEAAEKSLNRLKVNKEHKGVSVLKIAERGLLMVGLGFTRGTRASETSSSDDSSPSMRSTKPEYVSECEEDDISLASAMDRIMKNLRLEITQLRRSLEESRSDSEHLQNLAEKQAQKLAENALYTKELEDREMLLRQNVEELMMEIKEAEEEVARWREACELEVEAGINVATEHDRMVAMIKQELEKTKAALNISNGKLKLKEELAGAAMAAQEAAERSLHLADNRTMELREQIEELTGQLDEAEKRERDQHHRVRYICWPWPVLKFNPATSTSTTVQNVKRMLPEIASIASMKGTPDGYES